MSFKAMGVGQQAESEKLEVCSLTSEPVGTIKEVGVVEDSPETKEHLALANHLILQHIFRCLSLPELKGTRFVCRRWCLEAAKGFRATTTIHLEAPKVAEAGGRERLEELGAFVHRHLHLHTLTLSFLIHSWYHKVVHSTVDGGMDFKTYPYYAQQNNKEAMEELLNYLALTGGGVTELRLEMMLLDGEDSRLLSELLTRVPRLKRLSLDIIRFGTVGLMSPLTGVPPSLQTLELRFHEKPTVIKTTLRLLPLTHFLGQFNRISFLDLDGLGLTRGMCRDFCYKTLCLQAIANICTTNPAAFLKLDGLKIALEVGLFTGDPEPSEEGHHLTSFPRSLSNLYLDIQQVGEDAMVRVGRILQRHAPTLQVLDLIWRPTTMFESQMHINLPYLPNLTTLALGLSREEPECWTAETLDVFSLRHLFRGSLRNTLPSLHTLSILFEGESNEIWSLIFPLQTTGADDVKQLEFKQIRTLIMSMTVDCESSVLLRVHQIFPSLQMLRHVRVEGDQVFGCEHRVLKLSESLVRVGQWKVGVRAEWWHEYMSTHCQRHNQLAQMDFKWCEQVIGSDDIFRP